MNGVLAVGLAVLEGVGHAEGLLEGILFLLLIATPILRQRQEVDVQGTAIDLSREDVQCVSPI
jgi:hypothetical protein